MFFSTVMEGMRARRGTDTTTPSTQPEHGRRWVIARSGMYELGGGEGMRG